MSEPGCWLGRGCGLVGVRASFPKDVFILPALAGEGKCGLPGPAQAGLAPSAHPSHESGDRAEFWPLAGAGGPSGLRGFAEGLGASSSVG